MNKFAVIIAFLSAPSLQAAAIDGGDPRLGEKLYHHYCAACHGPDGRGAVSGTPDFTRDRERFAKGWDRVFERVVSGFQSPGSPMAMPPRGGADLSDEEIWDILAYIKKTFIEKGTQ